MSGVEFALFADATMFTIPRVRRPSVVTAAAARDAEVAVFSFVGVLGITVALFFAVAITARLILGR